MTKPTAQKLLAAMMATLIFLAPAACAIYTKDKCYLEDSKYQIVSKLFLESGSLDLVERQLVDYEWRRCEINEALYRLTKEFEVVPQ